MEDIFVSAKQGNQASVKGLYASSVSSAYAAVSAAVADEQKAAQIIQEIYVSAFADAGSYDEFFLLLNKRASSACTFASGSTVKIQSIAATQSAFVDVAQLELPATLSGFEQSLGGIVAQSAQAAAKSKPKLPLRLRRTKGGAEKGGDLKSFEEMVKKRDFAGFDDYTPPPEQEAEKPKTIAEKLQSEEIELSDEQLQLEQKEREKNRRTAVIAFVFSAIILAGAISTYFITKQIVTRREQSTVTGAGVNTELTIDKNYKPAEAYKAYRDYLNKILIKQYGKASLERTVAYNEGGDVGAEQLNGLLSYRVLDIDGDGAEELAAVVCSATHDNRNYYTYRYRLFLYRFADKKVTPMLEDYTLIEYSAYNRGGDYALGNFNMYLKEIDTGKARYLYAEAAGKDVQVCAFHYYESGKMFEGERFVSFSWNKNDFIYMQRRLDGTYEPLYLRINALFEKDAGKLSQRYKDAMAEYGFTLGNTAVRCKNGKELTAYFNKAFKRISYQLPGWDMRFDSEDTTDYWCYLHSVTEQGDMLSNRTVVRLTDFTELDAFLVGGDPNPWVKEETTEEEDTEVVVIPTTAPTTTTTTTEEETTEEEQEEQEEKQEEKKEEKN
ncbi:MAG: hypothetical protein E7517_09090 [Ruminococcaceae bacterium]|nr:hypothetical protein [Oscillospiraceae bacterium]